MNKRQLIDTVAAQLERDLAVLKQSARAAYEGAIHTESKPEDQYDTRGLEASYLAGAQARRAEELEGMITYFKFLDLKDFGENDPISATALVELESEGKRTWYFLMPKGGGLTVTYEGHTVQLVTPSSPLGGALMGQRVGDEVDVPVRGGSRGYEIVSVR